MPKSCLFASAFTRPAGAYLASLALAAAAAGVHPVAAAQVAASPTAAPVNTLPVTAAPLNTAPVNTAPAGAVARAAVSAPTTNNEPYGWSWLRNALDTLRPRADTRIPETSTQVAQRLENQINQGDAAAALSEIERRLAERKNSSISGTDVRLVFLRARALTALGRLPEATAAYRQMTVDYPELPEPWNNLAVVLVAQGQLDQAHDALAMAIRTHPEYAAAQANLADVLVLQAQRAYARAAELGSAAASRQLELLQPLVAGTQP